MITLKQYKRKTGCTFKQAKIAIDYFKFLKEKIKQVSICPLCGGELYLENGSYEEGYDDYIGCFECDFTNRVEGIYEYLTAWHGFDHILCSPEMYTPKQRKQEMRNLTIDRIKEMYSNI